MTTSSTSAVLSQAATANFQAWVQEIYTNLVTNCGLVQTQDSGQAAVPFAGALPAGTGVGNATGHYLFTFSDATAQGGITTTALVAGGSGYSGGPFANATVTGVTSGATSARATVTVSAGALINLTITTAGSGYIAGEKLTVTVGGGSGASWMPTVMSSGAPVVFRLDFGAGSLTTNPQMWIVVGAGSNGSGTVNGSAGTSAMTQVACFGGAAPASLVTPYTSRYCVNMTYGFVGLAFKIGANAVANTNVAIGGFHLFRTNDNGGNPLGTAAVLITNSSNTTGSAGTGPMMQCMSYSSGVGSTVYPTLSTANSPFFNAIPIGGAAVAIPPFNLTTTLENSTVFAFPFYTMDPVIRFNAFMAIALQADIAVGSTVSLAIIGSTTLTFLAVGYCYGTALSIFGFGNANTTFTFLMLWQ